VVEVVQTESTVVEASSTNVVVVGFRTLGRFFFEGDSSRSFLPDSSLDSFVPWSVVFFVLLLLFALLLDFDLDLDFALDSDLDFVSLLDNLLASVSAESERAVE